MMPFVLCTTPFWVQLCQTMSLLVVHFQVCCLIHSSNRFIQRPILIVLCVSIRRLLVLLWWLAALPTLQTCFSSIHLSVSKGFLSSIVKKLNMWHFQTQDHYALQNICLKQVICQSSYTLNQWNRLKPDRELREKAFIFANCKWRTG